MIEDVKAGMKHTRRIDIDAGRIISHMDEELAVYSTPSMVEDIEMTCQEFIQRHLPDEQNTVGTHVAVDHMAPTPAGAWVEVSIEVTGVDGRMVTMEAVVTDAVEQVGRGKHNRFVVDNEKTRERLIAKRKKIEGAG